MQIFDAIIDQRFGHINLAKPRHDGIQEPVFVLDHDEESRVVAEQFDATPECALRVDGQTVGIEEDNRLEFDVVAFDVGFSEKLEFFADELDALAVGAVDKHDIGLDFAALVVVVNQVDEIIHESSLARPVGAVK